MRISDWSSDVCSSDLVDRAAVVPRARRRREAPDLLGDSVHIDGKADAAVANQGEPQFLFAHGRRDSVSLVARSEEHTSELQSLMRTSYAVFCLTKTKRNRHLRSHHTSRT